MSKRLMPSRKEMTGAKLDKTKLSPWHPELVKAMQLQARKQADIEFLRPLVSWYALGIKGLPPRVANALDSLREYFEL